MNGCSSSMKKKLKQDIWRKTYSYIALQCPTFNAFLMPEAQQPIWGEPHMFCFGAEICIIVRTTVETESAGCPYHVLLKSKVLSTLILVLITGDTDYTVLYCIVLYSTVCLF